MLRQLLVGAGISICNIVIHAVIMTAVVRVAHRAASRETALPAALLISVMVATVSVLMAAHLCEVIVWSLAYAIVDAAPTRTDLVYFAFVNYTTLGYGDVTPVERWRLLGPMTAMNGVLLFGWSTAVIFEVLHRTMAHDPRVELLVPLVGIDEDHHRPQRRRAANHSRATLKWPQQRPTVQALGGRPWAIRS